MGSECVGLPVQRLHKHTPNGHPLGHSCAADSAPDQPSQDLLLSSSHVASPCAGIVSLLSHSPHHTLLLCHYNVSAFDWLTDGNSAAFNLLTGCNANVIDWL